MEGETTNQGRSAQYEPCLCRSLVSHIITAFGLTSEEARQHVRNARVEILKAMRSVIDERISHLSQPEAKGTKIVVE